MRERSKPPLVRVLAGILFAEAALLAAATVYLIVGLLVDRPDSYASGIALAVLTVLATVWVTLIAAHTLRGSPWIRGGAIVWQVLQASVAIGEMQGVDGRVDIGVWLLLPSIVVVVLLFTKPVLAWTARKETTEDPPLL